MTLAARRVAILHQGTVPTYRKAFYERLAKLGAADGVEYVVFHGDPEPGSGVKAAGGPFGFPNVPVRNRYLRFAGRTLVWQPVIGRILRGGYDGLVVGHEVKYLANMLLLCAFRLRGKPVVFWGFGDPIDYTATRRNAVGRLVGRAISAAKDQLLRMSTGYLAYTERGAQYVTRAGIDPDAVAVLYNTIDMEAEGRTHAAAQQIDPSEVRREFGLRDDSVVLAFVGRLTREKEVERLIDAVRASQTERAGAPAVELVIVGDGPHEETLRSVAGGALWCHFLGYRFGEQIARVFRIAAAVVIPGYVGLSVNHAFAHGVPVITRDLETHSPEIEYVVHGENGIILGATQPEFEAGLREFAVSPEQQAALRAGALATRSRLGLAPMVEAFHGLVSGQLARVAR